MRPAPSSTLFPYTTLFRSSVAIRADQTQAFEQVMGKLQQALKNSQNPQRRQQAAGWTLVRLKATLPEDRKSTRLNSSHSSISYAVFCLKKKTTHEDSTLHA